MDFLRILCVIASCTTVCWSGLGRDFRTDHWQCDDGAFLPGSWRCDGAGDCLDGSDEMECACQNGQFECTDGSGCVNRSLVCNNQPQCGDASDEADCPQDQSCLGGDWMCRNQICVLQEHLCNGKNDCVDNSDEDECDSCGSTSFRCLSGECLTGDQRCDGMAQCSDRSDEPFTCGRRCAVANAGCSHLCVDRSWGALCSCPKGWTLTANGTTCEDVDECSQPFGPCMQQCVNSLGSFTCTCSEGFKRQGSTSCRAQGNGTMVLALGERNARLVNPRTGKYKVLGSLKKNPVALAVDLVRNLFYWADDEGNINKVEDQSVKTLYAAGAGVKSLACDWLSGQLYWTNWKTKSIHVGVADERVFTVLAKDINPLDLVLLPTESVMFWINQRAGGMSIEMAGMDGSRRLTLVVVTAQLPRGLTLDVPARRLYWISDYKKSIETVKVDGTGRHSFLGVFNKATAFGLVVFEGWFLWTDEKQLWRAPQKRPDLKKLVLRASLPLLSSYHHSQQPQGDASCAKSRCHLCLPSLEDSKGYICTCPEGMFLTSSGSCEYFKLAYATPTSLYTLEFRDVDPVKTLVWTTDENILSFDIDRRLNWVFWTNGTGYVKRGSLAGDQSENIPTLNPACTIRVDPRTGRVYWLSCDELSLGVTAINRAGHRTSKLLYQSGSEISDVYVDWQRGSLFWLEDGKIFRMSLSGGNAKEVLEVQEKITQVVFDRKSNNFLWYSEDLQVFSLLKNRKYSSGRSWNIIGSIVAAQEPYLVSLLDDVITLWDRRDGQRVREVDVESGIVGVAVFGHMERDTKATPPNTNPNQAVRCTSPSVVCQGTSLCISHKQLCDGEEDCPDGSDEKSCLQECVDPADFLCSDRRKCIGKEEVCDGRAHCPDASDEVGCPTMPVVLLRQKSLKCRLGSKLCRDGSECVLYGHWCDGELDCVDGSDEDNCTVHTKWKPTKSCAFRCDNGTRCVPQTFRCDGEMDCLDGSDEMGCDLESIPTTATPSNTNPNQAERCTSPSVVCQGTSLCISHKQLCDGEEDCPDGSDEKFCLQECVDPADFLCSDRRKCIGKEEVCDGRAHCPDASDEVGCPTTPVVLLRQKSLKCRLGSKLCRDGSECVLYGHWCDGELDCVDGSDEDNCTVQCMTGQFQCAHGKKCIDVSQVCDGIPQCQDRSDEMKCWKPTKSCVHRCDKGTRCVPQKFRCDGEMDCLDGSDEAGCDLESIPTTATPSNTNPNQAERCTSPSVVCQGTSLCISHKQLCDGEEDCPDGSDEKSCLQECVDPADFLCSDRRKCIGKEEVCDGRAHCPDASDEVGCPTMPVVLLRQKSLKCRLGSKLCRDGSECVLYGHWCDGELDCVDGSDEDNCTVQCETGQFQCTHAKKCIDMSQVCDGIPQCQDRSDEMKCWKPTKSCAFRCDDGTRCVPQTFRCDGEMDCLDGSDELECVIEGCSSTMFQCRSGQCVSGGLRCNSYADCRDRSDEEGCTKPPRCPSQRRCPHSHECLLKEWICDGESDCRDGADEKNCKVSTAKCGEFQWFCASRTQCIPQFWRCDGVQDCGDASDEAGCGAEKCSPHLLQCGSGECLDPALACNGITDCLDGSDEGQACVTDTCSAPGRPPCAHNCYSTPQGTRCGCKVGFMLQADAVSCADVNECVEVQPMPCSHTCLNNRGSFLCLCHPGYLLEPDGRSCKTADEPFLLASVQQELLFIGVRSGNLDIFTSTKGLIISVDYDWAKRRVYWVSLEEETIGWTSMDKKSKGAVIKGVKTNCIAVDWVGKNLYWLNEVAGQILAVGLGSTAKKPQSYAVVLDGGLKQPTSLVLLPQKGLMFWSALGSRPQIERAGMDGSERKVVVGSVGRPVGLAVDGLADRLYWTDEKLGCIASATLEGDNVKLLQLTETPSPFSVTVFNDKIYWSDAKRRSIQSAQKGTGKNRKVLLKQPGQPFGLKVVHALLQEAVPNPCATLRCSHMCLLAPGQRGACHCPVGFQLTEDGVSCSAPNNSHFLLLLSPTTITQIPLQSLQGPVGLKTWPPHHSLPLPGVKKATALDSVLKDRLVCLADSDGGSVTLFKLGQKGFQRGNLVVQLQADTIMALALDWVTLNLYWSSGRQPQLHVTSARGGWTAALIVEDLKVPGSIALYPPGGLLCFTDLGGGSRTRVECAFMDGSMRRLVWGKAVTPTSLSLGNEGKKLYWADIAVGIIGSINTDGTGYKELQTSTGPIVSFALNDDFLFWVTLNGTSKMWYSDGFLPKQLWFEVESDIVEIKMYSRFSQKGSNICAVKNGGCRHLCLAVPGGRTCRCTQDYRPINGSDCIPLLQCRPGSRPCSDGRKCLPSAKFCDRRSDCLDRSDEENCSYSKGKSRTQSKGRGSKRPMPGARATQRPQYPLTGAESQSTPPPVITPPENEILVQEVDSRSCDERLCQGHGRCVELTGKTACHCQPGYSGDQCQDPGGLPDRVLLTLGLLCLLALFVTLLGFLIRWRRSKATETENAEKETLMKGLDDHVCYAQTFSNVMYNPNPEEESVASAEAEVTFSEIKG